MGKIDDFVLADSLLMAVLTSPDSVRCNRYNRCKRSAKVLCFNFMAWDRALPPSRGTERTPSVGGGLAGGGGEGPGIARSVTSNFYGPSTTFGSVVVRKTRRCSARSSARQTMISTYI